MEIKQKPLLLSILILFIAILNTGCGSILDGFKVTSVTGKATIGNSGGTIEVGDETSSIYGAKIEIPEGALDEDVEIQIVEGESFQVGSDEIPTVQFLPEGLEFTEPVTIAIPWSEAGLTEATAKVYHLNEEEFTITEMPVSSVDKEDEMTYAQTSHFSNFYSRKQNFSLGEEITLDGDIFIGTASLKSPLAEMMPCDPNSPHSSAQQIAMVTNGQNCLLSFDIYLSGKNSKGSFNTLAAQSYFVEFERSQSSYKVTVYKADPNNLKGDRIEVFSREGVTQAQILNVWLKGTPLIAHFDETAKWFEDKDVNDYNRFRVWGHWSLVKNMHPSLMKGSLFDSFWTWGYARGNYTLYQRNSISQFKGNDVNNNHVDDQYEGENDPPVVPQNPQPDNFAQNVTLTPTLTWECSDPEAKPLTYKVHFGTDSEPPLVETLEDVKSYSPGELQYETTYYWFVEAIDERGASSISEVWSFITETEGGATAPCDGITSVEYGGMTYHTVEIGEQCWFKENLNIGTRISDKEESTNNGVIEKYCYHGNEENCDTYGGMYSWNEMMQYTTDSLQGICPDGWHVPTDEEFVTLTTFLGGYSVAGGKLKESGTTHWVSPNEGATNESGFTGLPNGQILHQYDNQIGESGHIWTSSDAGTDKREWYLSTTSKSFFQGRQNAETGKVGLRCIKD
jgi:uncharacterized protein (TIGR02145 family)